MDNDASSYHESAPALREFLTRFERAVARTRAGHLGGGYDAVRSALVQAMSDEDVKPVVPAVMDELARQISEGHGVGWATPQKPVNQAQG